MAEIVTRVLDGDFAEVALVVMNAEGPKPLPRFSRLRKPRRHHLLFNLYQRLDTRLFRIDPDAFAPVDLEARLAGVPRLDVVPLRPRVFEHRFNPSDVAAVDAHNLDVLFRFGFNIIRGEILNCARHGVWSFHHGDNRLYRGSPDFFWEMYERERVVGTLLQVLTEDLDAGLVLYRSWSRMDPTSLYRSRNSAYWKTAEFAPRRLRELYEYGWDWIADLPGVGPSEAYEKDRIYKTPTNSQMLRFVARLVGGVTLRRVRRILFEEDWRIALRRFDGESQATSMLRLVPPSDGRWYTDPVLVIDDRAAHLFAEEFDLRAGRGRIAHALVEADGTVAPLRPVLERPYHLSYPFVFRFDGDWWLIPESGENRTVELYRCVSFPNEWERAKILLDDVFAVDSTVLFHDDRLWLFTSIAVDGSEVGDELFLYSARSPLDDWVPHPLNPVVSDVRRARPAGPIIRMGGALVRHSQDGSRRYGYAICLNAIEELSLSAYREVPVTRMEPRRKWRNRAMHTYNRAGGLEVLDVQQQHLRSVGSLLPHRRSAAS